MRKIELDQKRKVLIVTVLISLVILILGYFAGPGVFGNCIIISLFIVGTPQLILSYIEYKTLKEIEGMFPNFLRNLIESIRSGMSFHQAMVFASKSDYGKLTPEVRKMANQLSWGLSIDKVLSQFSMRVKHSRKLTRAIRIIIETFKSGGDIVTTLDSVAETSLILRELERERKSMLNQHVVLMYIICFIFIGIIIGINKLMIPIFKAPNLQQIGSTVGVIGFMSPCESVVPCQLTKEGKLSCYCVTDQITCTPCYIYYSICSLFGSKKGSISCYYIGLFFAMSVFQAIFSGLVAGQIGEGSITAGAKHSLVMLIITVGAFYILTYLKVLGG